MIKDDEKRYTPDGDLLPMQRDERARDEAQEHYIKNFIDIDSKPFIEKGYTINDKNNSASLESASHSNEASCSECEIDCKSATDSKSLTNTLCDAIVSEQKAEFDKKMDCVIKAIYENIKCSKEWLSNDNYETTIKKFKFRIMDHQLHYKMSYEDRSSMFGDCNSVMTFIKTHFKELKRRCRAEGLIMSLPIRVNRVSYNETIFTRDCIDVRLNPTNAKKEISEETTAAKIRESLSDSSVENQNDTESLIAQIAARIVLYTKKNPYKDKTNVLSDDAHYSLNINTIELIDDPVNAFIKPTKYDSELEKSVLTDVTCMGLFIKKNYKKIYKLCASEGLYIYKDMYLGNVCGVIVRLKPKVDTSAIIVSFIVLCSFAMALFLLIFIACSEALTI